MGDIGHYLIEKYVEDPSVDNAVPALVLFFKGKLSPRHLARPIGLSQPQAKHTV